MLAICASAGRRGLSSSFSSKDSFTTLIEATSQPSTSKLVYNVTHSGNSSVEALENPYFHSLVDSRGEILVQTGRYGQHDRNRVKENIVAGGCMFDSRTLIRCAIKDLTTTVFRSQIRYASSKSKSKEMAEFKLPSVTWGVLHGRKERLVSRVIICDYLKSNGIVTDELENLELPSTIDVMKERLEFLMRLGLTNDDVNRYPLMLACSVRKNIAPVIEYLLKLGFFKQEIVAYIRKYPQVLHASIIVDLVPVVKFLRGLDVESHDIPGVLLNYPELFGFKVEGTMSTSIGYLVSIGVNPRDVGPMITQYPQILGMQVTKMIKPKVDYLVNLGIPKQIVARMIEKRPYILGYDLESSMKHNVDMLLNYGVREAALASVIAQFPKILGMDLKKRLTTKQYFFNFNSKIGPEDFGKLLEKMPQVVSLPQICIKKRLSFFKDRGFSKDDISRMVLACPQLLLANVELMKRSFFYFKTDMRRPLSELVEFPEYFTYSLEFRIKPRYQRLLSKGISCSLDWMLNCSDKRFEERIDSRYVEKEVKGPSFNMGGALALPEDEIFSEVDDEESEDEVFYRRTLSL